MSIIDINHTPYPEYAPIENRLDAYLPDEINYTRKVIPPQPSPAAMAPMTLPPADPKIVAPIAISAAVGVALIIAIIYFVMKK